MTDPKTSIDLSFLGRDLRNQLAHSTDILNQVKILREAIEKIQNPEARQPIETAMRNLLGIVDSISANVTSTTASTTSTIATINFPSEKK